IESGSLGRHASIAKSIVSMLEHKPGLSPSACRPVRLVHFAAHSPDECKCINRIYFPFVVRCLHSGANPKHQEPAMKPLRTLGLALSLATCGWSSASLAHHSFAMYDQNELRTLTGKLTRFIPGANHAQMIFELLEA